VAGANKKKDIARWKSANTENLEIPRRAFFQFWYVQYKGTK